MLFFKSPCSINVAWLYRTSSMLPIHVTLLLGIPCMKKRYALLQGACTPLPGTCDAATRNNDAATGNKGGGDIAATGNCDAAARNTMTLLPGIRIVEKHRFSRSHAPATGNMRRKKALSYATGCMHPATGNMRTRCRELRPCHREHDARPCPCC